MFNVKCHEITSVVIGHIKTNLDLSRSFLILSVPRGSCPVRVHLACLTTSHPSVYVLMFPLSPLLRLTFLLTALSGLCLINLILYMTNAHTHMHTNSTKCVSLLLSSHSFIPISMSPLPLTHFYYSHRSLPLALWPPLCLSFCLGVYERSYIESVWLAQTHRRGGQRVR